MKRRLFSLLIALLLCAALPLSAAADAWIPPDNNVNYNVLSLPYSDKDCAPINAFVSNFVEANLRAYDQSSANDVVIATVLKHFELNAGIFSSYVTKVTGPDGNPYMKIAAGKFESRLQVLFGRSISAASCPGYEDGYITVSAANFGGPIQVFGSVYNCEYLGNYLYRANFDVFYVKRSFSSNWYATCNSSVPADSVTQLGGGYAVFRFDGSTSQSTFSSSDFTLVEFSMNAEGIPCTNANLPYTPPQTEPPTEASTEAPTEASTQPQTEPSTEESTEALTAPTEPSGEASEPEQTPDGEEDEEDDDSYRPNRSSQGGDTRKLVLITVLVVASAVFALAVILLVFRRK